MSMVISTYLLLIGTSSGFLTLTINIGSLLFSVCFFKDNYLIIFIFIKIVGIAGVFSDKHPERAKAMSWVATGGLVFAL